MNRRPNRVILTFVALLLIVVGVVGLLATAGLVVLQQPAEVYEQMVAGAAAYPWAWLLGIIAGGLVVALLGAWLVMRQLGGRGSGRLGTVVVQRADRGRTTLKAAAVTRAAAADLRNHTTIQESSVRMATFGARPRFLVNLSVSTDTEPLRALEAAEGVYERLTRVLGADKVIVDTRLRLRPKALSRVE